MLVNRFNVKQTAAAFILFTAVLTGAALYWESLSTVANNGEGENIVIVESMRAGPNGVLEQSPTTSWKQDFRGIDDRDVNLDQLPSRPIRGANPCDVSQTLKAIDTWQDLNKYTGCRQVFYNRVPKCGSRTVLSFFKIFAANHSHFHVHGWNKLASGYNYLADQSELTSYMKSYNALEEPFLVSQHIYFLNFTRYGQQPPMFINVIRDPVERLISHYYFNVYGTKAAPVTQRRALYNQSLDKCVALRNDSCLSLKQYLSYFCGQGLRCRNRTPAALAVAKTTVRMAFLTVGVTEDLAAFMQVLEILAPQFFQGASEAFEAIQSQRHARYRTIHKPAVKPETIAFLKDHLAIEYDFYHFVKQRFYTLYGKLKTLTQQRALDKGGDEPLAPSGEDIKSNLEVPSNLGSSTSDRAGEEEEGTRGEERWVGQDDDIDGEQKIEDDYEAKNLQFPAQRNRVPLLQG